MKTITLSVLALLLAGCADPTQTPSAANATILEPAPLALYLQADLTLAPAPPASEGSVAPAVIANGPWVDDRDYPTWTITLDRALANGTANVTFFVTSSSASFAATFVPFFAALPQFVVAVADGANETQVDAAGPSVLRAGEVAEVHAQVPLDGLVLAPGTPLSLRLAPYYSQVTVVEEVRFVMGPEHPASIEFAKNLMP